MAPQSFLCLMHLPRAWLRALKAWISYHSPPLRIFGSLVARLLSLYLRFKSTSES